MPRENPLLDYRLFEFASPTECENTENTRPDTLVMCCVFIGHRLDYRVVAEETVEPLSHLNSGCGHMCLIYSQREASF